MHPDSNHPPDEIDARFAQIMQQEVWHDVPPSLPRWERPRRPWRRWLAVGGLVMAVFLVGTTGLVLAVLQARPPTAEPTAEDLVLQQVHRVLSQQREALLAGDEAGYLAALDDAAGSDDREALARQFHSLQAMKVAGWRDEIEVLGERGEGRWAVNIGSYPCFVTAPCDDGLALSSTVWQITDGGSTLIDIRPALQPHPWQVSELVARSGQRTIVATTEDHADQLPMVLREAERAALVADRFAREEPPARYVVYYAGKKEWGKWFGWSPSRWAAAAAISLGDDRYDVVLGGENMDAHTIAGHLRHELTHAASLPGRQRHDPADWWLVEGIAEFAEADGMPVRHHPGLRGVGEVLTDSATGFALGKPADDAGDVQVGGSYATAFLAARCLTERFGESRFVQFFHSVIHDGKPLAEASADAFGVPWADLSADCLDYLASATADL